MATFQKTSPLSAVLRPVFLEAVPLEPEGFYTRKATANSQRESPKAPRKGEAEPRQRKKKGGGGKIPPLPLLGFLKKQAAPAPSGSLAAGFHRGLSPSRCSAEEDTHNRRLLRLAKGSFCVGGRREVLAAAFQEAPRGGRFSGPEGGRNRRLQDLTARKSSGIFFAGGREACATELPAKRLGGDMFYCQRPPSGGCGKEQRRASVAFDSIKALQPSRQPSGNPGLTGTKGDNP